ncbi:MAG TPA: hypothetical protein VK614_13940 [Allosphingosinicella sp.]|nr:hypothetical protein [Allosphingosinicella sp.]
MAEWIDTLFADFVDEQMKLAESKYQGAKNYNIYDKRLTEPNTDLWLTPHSMYFYYVRINADGRLVIDHYFYVKGDLSNPHSWQKINYDEEILRDIITKLAKNARPIVQAEPRERDPPRLRKGDFKKTKWCRKSYIAIFFDEGNWSLRKKPKDETESAVTFIVEEGNKKGLPNHSFFDAMDLDITMPIRHPRPGGPTEDKRSAIVFVNHMKRDEDGNDLGDEEQDFVFKIIVNVNAEMPDDPPTVVIIDPGGTNDGPPLPPPPAD